MQQTKLNRRWFLTAAAAVAAATGIGGGFWWLRSRGPAKTLDAERISGDLPIADPGSKLWRKADRVDLPLIAQQMALPWLAKATLKEVSLRALFNGTQLGFLLEWGDEQVNDLESIVRFRDAAAVMVPQDPGAARPPIFMGMKGKPVYIMQWKASWQKDVDAGFQGVEKSYPRWFNDVYPGGPVLAEQGMKPETALSYYPGLAADNPISRQTRTSPVEALIAEGFGTLTSLPEQPVQGKGLWADGRWKVSIGLPVGGTAPAIQPGGRLPVAMAIWDGSRQQRGSRKHFVDWIEVILPGG